MDASAALLNRDQIFYVAAKLPTSDGSTMNPRQSQDKAHGGAIQKRTLNTKYKIQNKNSKYKIQNKN